jgi:hypothetical protein
MSRRTFLVTGATGDTGGATVEQMLARGHHVRALAHRQDDRAKRLQGLGFPASSPAVLACGGTSLPSGGTEVVWNNGPGNGATGGGPALRSLMAGSFHFLSFPWVISPGLRRLSCPAL